MSCGGLATTGPPLAQLLAAGGLCLLTGWFLLAFARHRRARNAALLTLVLIGSVLAAASSGSSAARAATVGCLVATPPGPPVGQPGSGSPTPSPTPTPTPSHFQLVITQTSIDVGIAPEQPPRLITGLVVNNSTDSSFVAAITVSIASVTKSPYAVPGTCDASDYTLTDAVMPVGRTLAIGGSATFSGAYLGFDNKPTLQDACKGATITLLYTSS